MIADMPRSATVRAVTDVDVLSIGRAAFTRLVGKCARIIERNTQLYEATQTQLKEIKRSISISQIQIAVNPPRVKNDEKAHERTGGENGGTNPAPAVTAGEAATEDSSGGKFDF